MLDEGVLFEHYERTLKPRLRALEKQREALLAAWKRAGLLVGVPGFVLWLTAGSRGRLGMLAVIAGVALLVGLVISGRQLLGDSTLSWSAYRQRFKRDVVSQVFRLVCPGATYVPHAGIERALFDAGGLFTTRIDSYSSDDLVRGRIGSTPFEAGDVSASYTTGSGKNRKTWEVLRGLYLRLDFNKRLRGQTIVEPEQAPAWRMRNRASLQKVALEDPDFERRYAVFASDPVEARYILTPLLMERILSLEAQAGRAVHLSFLGDSVHLAVHYGRALFEPTLLSSLSYDSVLEIAKQFGLAELIVSELDLNVRLWSKAAAPMPAAAAERSSAPQSVAAAKPGRAADVSLPPSHLSRAEVLAQLPEVGGPVEVRGAGPWWGASNVIGLLVGLAVYVQVDAAIRGGEGPTEKGILILIFGGGAAFIAWVGYAVFAGSRQGWQKLVVYALGLAFFWFGFLTPLQRSRAAQARPAAYASTAPTAMPTATPTATPTRAEREAAAEEEHRTREELVAHLRATGAHGPLGVVPPMLEVRDTGDYWMTVKNLGGSLVWVELAKLKESPPGSGSYFACELYADPGRRRGRYDGIKPQERVQFRMGATCDTSFRSQPIEYRVGRNTSDESWWSDTALVQPDGHRRAGY